MNCIFGPVNSRRLGRSLGIDLFLDKICNLNCLYCEVGRTITPVGRRDYYSDTNAILAEIDRFCSDTSRLAEVDVVTVTASGEPTLHKDLGKILRHIKATTNKPLAVLTNGTTLHDPQVRAELLVADIVTPSLDSAREESFRKIDRPIQGLHLSEIIAGLQAFSHEYQGKLWLEILFVQGINDTDADIEALIAALRPMRIDRIQLNTVVRPPAESFAHAVPSPELSAIGARIQEALSLPVDFPHEPAPKTVFPEQSPSATSCAADEEGIVQAIVEMLQRRPCTAADIDRTFHTQGPEKVERLLEPLIRSHTLQIQEHGGQRFYQIAS